jgi:IS605 OrfB family transposase
VSVETNKIPEPTTETGILGIDRGINNVAVTSANQFFNSKAINNVRCKYAYLRKQLQSKGTRSAKRKLIELSGRERRFKADVNHRIAKEIVNSPYGMFVLEDLSGIRERNQCKKKGGKHGRTMNRKLGSWSFLQLEQFVHYKAEGLGKAVLLVDASYTSQRCSQCGHIAKENRDGAKFHCHSCGFELHADLNASRNIALLGTSELSRLHVNKPNVAPT